MDAATRQVLRGAKVVDGTGAAARSADVVVEGDRIVSVADPCTADGEVVDLDGLVLSPGFVDCHTHYDAQVLWDRDLTPSSWHGVTTVVMGNCGFGIAPVRPEHRETIARTLENVEGMSIEALDAGIPWSFESFPEYLAAIESGGTRLNAAVMIGHTPLRLYVLGEDATERAATDAEVAEMRRLVGDALDAGAVGFATSKSDAHAGAWGKPVPSRLADPSEIMEIAGAMSDRNRGVFAVTRGTDFQIQQMAELHRRTGRPVTFTALSVRPDNAETLDEISATGAEIWPQVAIRPIVMQLTLADPGPLVRAAALNEVVCLPRDQRPSLYRDSAWRDRARVDLARTWGERYERISVQETKVHQGLQNGPSIAEIAASRGQHPFDVMCDLALADDLQTRFRVVLANDDEIGLANLLVDDRILVGLSDAGAHASQLCDAVFSTHMLQHWVRETGVLSLERAVHHLTGHPAEVFRLPGRGRLQPGAFADLVAFDPHSIAVEQMERVFDLPAGADRLVARSRGIEWMWVNGTTVRSDGKDRDPVRPGTLIRDGGR